MARERKINAQIIETIAITEQPNDKIAKTLHPNTT
jgi:hypothetical protein